MTSILDEKGAATAVTLLSASPNVVTQLKTDETDGYGAVQLGFENSKRPAKAQAGHFKPSKTTPKLTREFRITGEEDTVLAVGDHLAADSFSVGDIIGSMYPQRIFPGKKMAGQMGHEQVTTKNLRVAIIDTDLQVIGVAGAVPGPRKGLVLIKGTK